MQLLFFYNEITRPYSRRDVDDPKLIDMLPVLVKISEKLLQSNGAEAAYSFYEIEGLDHKRMLNCQSKTQCDQCTKY